MLESFNEYVADLGADLRGFGWRREWLEREGVACLIWMDFGEPPSFPLSQVVLT